MVKQTNKKCNYCTATIQTGEKHILEYDNEYGVVCRVEGVFNNYNKLLKGKK
tara:strand:- start:278 stop:433 length:156 start_codon:yes stop_codon:yes gene_type:complete